MGKSRIAMNKYVGFAIPMLAGSEAVVTTMNFASKDTWTHSAIIILAFGLVCFLNYLIFSARKILIKKLGHHVIAVISKLMGLIITTIGIDMIIRGLKLSFLFLR